MGFWGFLLPDFNLPSRIFFNELVDNEHNFLAELLDLTRLIDVLVRMEDQGEFSNHCAPKLVIHKHSFSQFDLLIGRSILLIDKSQKSDTTLLLFSSNLD